MTLIEPGMIRGTVWIDADRDGQREPGELPAGAGIGLGEVRVFTQDGSEIFNIPVDAEGHYSLAVKPNRYYVEATDSDVVLVFADEFGAIAESHVFEVTSGGEMIIDVGLTEEPLT